MSIERFGLSPDEIAEQMKKYQEVYTHLKIICCDGVWGIEEADGLFIAFPRSGNGLPIVVNSTTPTHTQSSEVFSKRSMEGGKPIL